jgi:4-amino-4-deoxy-L-arabinose transferase-like glycosyltransferase
MQTLRPSKPASFGNSWAIASAVVLLGFLLRLYRIDQQSVWYDEIFSLAVSQLPHQEMTQKLVEDIVQPPLHYYLLHILFKLFGFGPLQARLLSVVWGTLAIVMVYLLGKHLFDRRTALLSALLLAVSQISVMYSQEARPYAQLLFFVLCCSYLFVLAIRTNRSLLWWGFILSATLAAYTHYYGLFAVLALIFFAALYRERYPVPLHRWVGGLVLGLLLYSPWLMSGIIEQALRTQKLRFGQYVDSPTLHWWTFVSVANTFHNGRPAGLLESSPWWTFPLGGLLFGVPLLVALQPLTRMFRTERVDQVRPESVLLVVLLCAVPISLALAVGALHGPYHIRYVSFCAATYYLLVASGLSALKPAWLRNALVVFSLAYSLYSLNANYFIPYKENHRDALAYLAGERKQGDCYLVAPEWEERQVRWAWSIYHASLPDLKVTDLDGVRSGSTPCGRVWFISIAYRGLPAAISISNEARERLETIYARVASRRFFWIDVDLYERKK